MRGGGSWRVSEQRRLNGWRREKNGGGPGEEGVGSKRGIDRLRVRPDLAAWPPGSLRRLRAGGKIKPRNVNLFSIVTVELGQKKCA